jgi:uncharacterized membrane protein
MNKYLPELVKENIISQEIADKISDYYNKKKKLGQNRIFLIFGVLGALLVGLGIILIIAHNWDMLPKLIKTVLALLPLIVTQILCGYAILKQKDNPVWKESSATSLFFAIGATISLISQIYHISGDLSLFLLTWMCLFVPMIYIMMSSFSSLLYISGITYYACVAGYSYGSNSEPLIYWVLLLLIIPYYYYLSKNKPESNFLRFHNLLIAGSIIICLGTLSAHNGELMYISYFSLFAIFLTFDFNLVTNKTELQDRLFIIIGFAGTLFLLFILSFNWYWEDFVSTKPYKGSLLFTREMITLVVTTLIAILLLIKKYYSKGIIKFKPVEFIFLFFILTYLIGIKHPSISIILINAMIFILGITTLINGIKTDHLGVLNLGLFIIALLIICRFFDTHLSFLLRGILFVLVGVGIIVTNSQILKNRKKNEN